MDPPHVHSRRKLPKHVTPGKWKWNTKRASAKGRRKRKGRNSRQTRELLMVTCLKSLLFCFQIILILVQHVCEEDMLWKQQALIQYQKQCLDHDDRFECLMVKATELNPWDYSSVSGWVLTLPYKLAIKWCPARSRACSKWPDIKIVWICEIASLICCFCPGVAEHECRN